MVNLALANVKDSIRPPRNSRDQTWSRWAASGWSISASPGAGLLPAGVLVSVYTQLATCEQLYTLLSVLSRRRSNRLPREARGVTIESVPAALGLWERFYDPPR